MKFYQLSESRQALLNRLDERGRGIVRIGDRKICLMLHKEKLHAFDHLCPHAKHSLLDGIINFQNEIVCPLHAYRFSLKDGVESEQRTNDLKIHVLEERNDGVFIGLDE